MAPTRLAHDLPSLHPLSIANPLAVFSSVVLQVDSVYGRTVGITFVKLGNIMREPYKDRPRSFNTESSCIPIQQQIPLKAIYGLYRECIGPGCTPVYRSTRTAIEHNLAMVPVSVPVPYRHLATVMRTPRHRVFSLDRDSRKNRMNWGEIAT